MRVAGVLGPAALIVLVVLFGSGRTAAQVVPEHEVKAAFLFNFTKFVTWPGAPRAEEPFRVCVIADAAATVAVQRTMAGEVVSGRTAQTVVPASAEQARACHILYVGRDADERGAQFLAAVRQAPVLTVGDGQRFIERGGMIRFVVEEGRVRFDVHQRRAADAGLAINSRLLRVARSVEGSE